MSKTVEDIGTLKINLLSQAQYDAEKAGGRLADDELYLTPSSGTGVSDVEVNGTSVVSGGVAEIELKTINQNSIVGSGDITIQGGAGVFVAEYGVTTYADIVDAIDDGQSVVCTMTSGDDTYVLQLVGYDDDGVSFSSVDNRISRSIFVGTDDNWFSSNYVTATDDTATTSANGLMSATDKTKLNGIASGAEVNVQSNWSQSDSTSDDYIKNKPTIPTKTSDLVNDGLMPSQITNSENDTFDVSLSGNGTTTAGMYTTFTYNNGAQVKVPFSIVGNGTSGNVETKIYGLPTPTQNDQAVNKKYVDDSVPTKVSDLTNDAGYITGYTETDPTVPSWAKQVSKPSYTASEVGALPDTTPIPSKTSQLNNDSGFITGVTSTSTPTASTIAEFDSSAHMNSADMSAQDVSDFVDGLNIQKVLKTVETKTLLWTNPDPTSAFATQIATFSNPDSYDGFDIQYLGYNSNDQIDIHFTNRMDYDKTFLTYITGSSGTTNGTVYIFKRSVERVATGLQFGSCYSVNGAGNWASYSANTGIVPYKIYGYKLEQL